jgi:hypothetical protein
MRNIKEIDNEIVKLSKIQNLASLKENEKERAWWIMLTLQWVKTKKTKGLDICPTQFAICGPVSKIKAIEKQIKRLP